MGQIKFEIITAQAGPDAHLFGLNYNYEIWAIGIPNLANAMCNF
ncbi:hypothetical protein [Ktedonosporobacter rubrisoli]|nr:hypothetical protein [Ktedonosporobacter rubrisoli]